MKSTTSYPQLSIPELQALNKKLKRSGRRICPKCRQKLPRKEFNKHPSWCKECTREAGRKWAAAHREHYRRNSKLYRENVDNGRPLYFKYAQARARALRRGIEFNLSYDDFTPLPDICPVLGIPLNYNRRGKVFDDSPSLDRVDNSRGYVPGNVAVISWRANRLKLNATAAELERIAAWMRSYGAP